MLGQHGTENGIYTVGNLITETLKTELSTQIYTSIAHLTSIPGHKCGVISNADSALLCLGLSSAIQENNPPSCYQYTVGAHDTVEIPMAAPST